MRAWFAAAPLALLTGCVNPYYYPMPTYVPPAYYQRLPPPEPWPSLPPLLPSPELAPQPEPRATELPRFEPPQFEPETVPEMPAPVAPAPSLPPESPPASAPPRAETGPGANVPMEGFRPMRGQTRPGL